MKIVNRIILVAKVRSNNQKMHGVKLILKQYESPTQSAP